MTTPQAPDAGLRKALEPFALAMTESEAFLQGTGYARSLPTGHVCTEDFRRAREALSAVPTVDVGGDSSSNASRAAQGTTALLPQTLSDLEQEAYAAIADQEDDAAQAFEGERTDLWEPAEVAVSAPILLRLIAIAKAVQP